MKDEVSCELTTAEVDYIDQTIADLRAENAKLRELVRDMWGWTHRPCSDCEHWQRITSNVGACSAGHCVLRSSIESRLREFGLEDS